MNNTQKVIIAIIIIVLAYLLWQRYFVLPNKPYMPAIIPDRTPPFATADKYSEVTINKDSIFNNAEVTGYGARFFVTPINEFDSGRRNVNYGDFIFTDSALQTQSVLGNNPPLGTIVGIKLTKDVKVLVPNQVILMS